MTEKTSKTPIRASEEGWIDLRDFNDTVFHGTAAHLAGKLIIAPASLKGIECRDLTDPGTLKELLDHYNEASFPGDDPRSAVSYWSQWYFGYLLPPLILLASAAKVYLPANLSAWRLILTDSGQPDRFILCDPFAQSFF